MIFKGKILSNNLKVQRWITRTKFLIKIIYCFNNRGKYIQWKNNIGKTLNILFNNKEYKMTIIDVFNTKSAIMVQLKWNDNILKPMASSMIKNMNFFFGRVLAVLVVLFFLELV